MKKTQQTKQITQKQRRDLIKSHLRIAPELSNRAIGKSIGVSHHTVGKIREEMIEAGHIARVETQAYDWLMHPYIKQHPELLESATEREVRALKAEGVIDIMQEKNSMSAIYCQRLLNRRNKEARKTALVELSSEDVRLIHADIRNGLSEIADKSVDLLLVDPVYSKEFLPLLSDISSLADRVLRDNGNLLVLFGNRHLPEAMQRLSEHMQYHWTLAYMTPAGGSPSLPWLGVATYWKPLLWFRKPGQPYKGEMIYDIVNTGKPLKAADKAHIWEQDIVGMMSIIERFTDPGDTILDCCCGSGTVGVACVQLGRKFIGVDIDTEAVRTARERLAQALENKDL